MVYGTIKNGVVVLDSAADMKDGTRVRVEPEPESLASFSRGSPQAVLSVKMKWAGPPNEVDALLDEVQRLREEDLELQKQRDP